MSADAVAQANGIVAEVAAGPTAQIARGLDALRALAEHVARTKRLTRGAT